MLMLAHMVHRKGILCALIAVCIIILVSFLLITNILQPYSFAASDLLYKAKPAPDNIVVVSIDDKSLQEIGRWPWNRTLFADVIKKLNKSAAIGIDIAFYEPSDNYDDSNLASAIKSSKVPIVLASEFGYSDGKSFYLKPVFAAETGHVNLIPDSLGIIRLAPSQINGIPSFSARVSELANGPSALPEQVLISFGDIQQISFVDVLKGSQFDFSSKIVVIGVTAPSFHDNHPVPINKKTQMAGSVIHANAINTIANQDFLKRQGKSSVFIFIILFAAITALFFWRLPALWAALSAAALMVGYIFYAMHSFNNNIIYDILHPVLSSFLVGVGCTVFLYISESASRKWVSSVFGKYVPKEVAAEILHSSRTGKEIKLGGERREITILFSDIRGFTTLSEQMEPEQLVEILNEYLSAMSDVLQSQKGIIDKYIGDAIMAFWNAPVKQQNHAFLACTAAIEMVEELKKLNNSFEKRKLFPLKSGIGIHTGDAIVGNVGSKNRISYTAIGDNVNLASRLEGLTKEYGVSIIISETTFESVKDYFSCRELDIVQVKGKKKPIRIYELIGRTDKREPLIALYAKALASYRKGEWHKAIDEFNAVLKIKEDGPSRLMVSRCNEYLKNPPEKWGGVHAMTKK